MIKGLITLSRMRQEAKKAGITVAELALTGYRNGDEYVLSEEDFDEVCKILAAETHPDQPIGEILNSMRKHIQ